LVPTSMTLNDLERRNSLYFAFFSPNSTHKHTHRNKQSIKEMLEEENTGLIN